MEVFMDDNRDNIIKEKKRWEETTVKKALSKFSYMKESPVRFYTPVDQTEFDFLEKVGFPGEYPFTAGTYPFSPMTGLAKLLAKAPRGTTGQTRAAMYSGYGAPEDTRDYYKMLI